MYQAKTQLHFQIFVLHNTENFLIEILVPGQTIALCKNAKFLGLDLIPTKQLNSAR